MRITKVDVFHVRWPGGGRSAWVRVWDEAGRYGLGEASPMAGGDAALTILAGALAPLVGADVLDTSVLHHRLFHQHIKLGPDGALAAALAALDIALWDLKGKLLGQPIFKLLGGAWRTTLPFYASVGGNAHRSVDAVCQAVTGRLKDSPALVKIRFDGDKTQRDADIAGDIAKARAVRKLVGDDFPLAFDANNTYSVGGAIRVGRVLEELNYAWFEEPVLHYHPDSFAQVARALPGIPVAAGEQEYTLRGIRQLIEAGVGIVQPDIVKTGGFTGMQEMAALARTHGVDLVPHQTQPSIGHVANLHFVATLLHGHHPAEYNVAVPSEQNVVFRDPPRLQDGLWTVPDAPGLGLEINEDELAKRTESWAGAQR